MRLLRKRILIFLLAVLGLQTAVIAQQFSDLTYVIADLSDANITPQLIQTELFNPNKGLEIKLFYNYSDSKLMLAPLEKGVDFATFAALLKPILQNNTNRIYPLFIDYTGPIRELNDAFTQTGLSKFLYYLPPGERWPLTQEILLMNKNLVVFTFQKTQSVSSYFHYAWDYISEFPHSGNEDPNFDGYYPNGDISKELLLIRDLEIPFSRDPQVAFIQDLNQNQFYINHLLSRWKYTGKKPTFVFSKNNPIGYSPLISWLSTYKSVKGVVRIGDKPMEKVFWKHSNRCITNGFFNFPYSEGEELNLTPYSPGYKFDPQTLIVSNENQLPSYVFSGNPIDLDEGLTGYFSFDDNLENFLDPQLQIVPHNITFTTDVNRGEVVKIPKGAFISIGLPEKYGIKNSSFTVSTWIKLNEVDLGKEYSILGTNEGIYRKGLHLVIRQGRPYFGFYGNDLWSEKIVTPNEWHHIVYRYNYFNGEQAIYYDGKNIGASLSHSSFIGDSTLLVGQAIGVQNFLNGYVDDLFIWNRPIGEEDIQHLFNSEYKPEIIKPETSSFPYYYYLLLLIPALAIFIYGKQKQRKKSGTGIIKSNKKQHENKNALFLFGEFQLFNSEGEELSTNFTPKIKELFLLLIIYSVKNKKGIKTDKLTAILWPGFEAQKAANNRSVSFNKLRKIIDSVRGLELIYQNGIWKVVFNEPLFCDYLEAFAILNKNDNPSKKDMESFFHYVKKGVFLAELQWEWLDEIRGIVTNNVIDTLLTYSKLLDEKNDCKTLMACAERILAIDDLNETATQIVIKQLVDNNNLNMAKYRYSQFVNNYQDTYLQTYALKFDQFLSAKF